MADGFEEVEAVTPIDYLRHVGLNVVTVGVQNKTITSARKFFITCDKALNEVVNEVPKAVIFPGGLPNTKTLSETEVVKTIAIKTNKNGLIVRNLRHPPLFFPSGAFGKQKVYLLSRNGRYSKKQS